MIRCLIFGKTGVNMIKITDAAKEKLEPILSDNPGKYLRIILDGVG